MTVFLEKFKVIFPNHSLHGKTLDFVIKNGKFHQIGKNLKPRKVSKQFSKGLLSPGWVDVGTHLTAPGFEHRDTVTSLLDTAAAGGFTDIITLPNTYPNLDNATAIRSAIATSQHHPVRLHPLGSASVNSEGNSLVEMHDMKDAGAVGFTDGIHSITDEGKLYRTLQYARAVGTTIVNQPKLQGLAHGWQMHEGEINVTLGLIGQPSLVEDIAVSRDIKVNHYAAGKLILHKLSSPSAISAAASDKKSNIFNSVSYLNVVLTDNVLETFDSNYKVDPPLRAPSDAKKVVKSINSGKVDMIVSDHHPLDIEAKLVEFDQAKFGAIGLQTFFPALNTYAKDINIDTLINCVAINPREIFGMEMPTLEEGAVANITLFDPKQESILDSKTNKSKSNNSPFWEAILQGKILGIFASGDFVENS